MASTLNNESLMKLNAEIDNKPFKQYSKILFGDDSDEDGSNKLGSCGKGKYNFTKQGDGIHEDSKKDKKHKKSMAQELGIPSTIWDEEQKIYVTNPALIDYEEKLKSNRQKLKKEKEQKTVVISKNNDDLKKQDETKKENSQTKDKNGNKNEVSDAEMSQDVEDELIDKQMIKDCYKDIIETKNEIDDNLRCDLCLDNNSYVGNVLVVCDLCLSAVHQCCYGLELKEQVPEDDWYCQRCEHLILKFKDDGEQDKDSPGCYFCEDKKGIMIQMNEGPLKDEWVHIVCINWSNLCSFQLKYNSEGELEMFYKLDYLPDQKYFGTDECIFCKSKAGSTIKCDFGNCPCRFHVRCAIDNNLIRTRQEMEAQHSKAIIGQVYIFCSDHLQEGIEKLQEKGDQYIKSRNTQSPVKKEFTPAKSVKKHKKMKSLSQPLVKTEPVYMSSQESVIIEKPREQPFQKKIRKINLLPERKNQIKIDMQKAEELLMNEIGMDSILQEKSTEQTQTKKRKPRQSKESKEKKKQNSKSKEQSKDESKEKQPKKISLKDKIRAKKKAKKKDLLKEDKFQKMLSQKFKREKARMQKQALPFKKPSPSAVQELQAEIIKPYKPLKSLPKINNSSKQPLQNTPQKQISGLKMHLIVEQLLQNITNANNNSVVNQSQLQQQQPSQFAMSCNGGLPDQQYNSDVTTQHTTPQKQLSSAQPTVKLVQVKSDLARLIKLPKVVINVEELIIRLKNYLIQRGHLRVLDDMRFFIDLSNNEELRNMIGKDIIKGQLVEDGDLEIELWKAIENLVIVLKNPI